MIAIEMFLMSYNSIAYIFIYLFITKEEHTTGTGTNINNIYSSSSRRRSTGCTRCYPSFATPEVWNTSEGAHMQKEKTTRGLRLMQKVDNTEVVYTKILTMHT